VVINNQVINNNNKWEIIPFIVINIGYFSHVNWLAPGLKNTRLTGMLSKRNLIEAGRPICHIEKTR